MCFWKFLLISVKLQCVMFHYVSCLPVFNKEIALKNVHILMVFTDSFIGPLHKIQNLRIQNCVYVKSIYSYSSHTAFSQGLGDNSFSQVEKCVTKITERQPPNFKLLPSPMFLVLYMIVDQSALIPRKHPCPKKALVTRLQRDNNM